MSQKNRRKRPEQSDDLNLIPVMNLFVCLLPFLLMTAAFTQLGAVDSELPSQREAADQSSELPQEKAEKVELVFEVKTDQLVVTAFTHGYSRPLPNLKVSLAQDDEIALQSFLNELKGQFQSISSSLFKVDAGVSFDAAIQVLSRLRQNDDLPAITLATEAL